MAGQRVDVAEKDSPGWWLQGLGQQLAKNQSRLNVLASYFDGSPPLPSSAPTARRAYRLFQKTARVNFAEMIVLAPRHRMNPVGFRTGAAGDENGDKAAWELWNLNDLDVEATTVHEHMLSMGAGYAIVGADEEGQPLITAEDPRQVVTVHDPRVRRRVRAGLKRFRDEQERMEFAYVYLPGQVFVASKPLSDMDVTGVGFRASDWTWEPDLSSPLPKGFKDIVPVVRFLNTRDGKGEFETHVDHLDRINTIILQEVIGVVMQAFRQRAVKGDLPEYDDRGNPIDYNDLFQAGPDALWRLPDGVDLWESGGLDITPILGAIREDALRLAAVTFTPMHMFSPDAATGSAEGASLMREGLVFKTEDRIKRASIGWRQVMSLAFRVAGDDTRADLRALQPIWASPERRSLAEVADAVTKLKGTIPWRSLMTEVMHFPPEVVDRMEAERAGDAFLTAATMQVPVGVPAQPAVEEPAEETPEPVADVVPTSA